MPEYIKEACVETMEQLLKAKKNGAHRIELCARLDLDGTTPSEEIILAAKDSGIPIRVMVRPRGGNFIYNSHELEVMENSIKFCKGVGVEGLVFGIQNEIKELDYEKISRLARLARPLKVVIHKVIDETPDLLDAVNKLNKIPGINSILTSGGMPTAREGKDNLKKMLKVAGPDLEVVVAGKVTKANIEQLHQYLNASAYHGRQIVGTL